MNFTENKRKTALLAKMIFLLLIFIFAFSFQREAFADGNEPKKENPVALEEAEAQKTGITASCKFSKEGAAFGAKLKDNKESTAVLLKKGEELKIEAPMPIQGLYIIYEKRSAKGRIKASGVEALLGEKGFLHEYIQIPKKGDANSLTLIYDEGARIAEIEVLGEGPLPQFVELWKEPLKEADLLLLSTHGDDEQLFFAGLLPKYVAEGADVQVSYMTIHSADPKRMHEQLHGLYTVGIRNYPVWGPVPDAYSTSLEEALENMEAAGLKEEDAITYVARLFRRFKPLVTVTHDEKGEYSHGQHILSAHSFKKALDLSGKSSFDEESLLKYGAYEVPKAYLHLYKENPIVMDYDTPLEYFGGRTAYEMSREGYACHLSQQWTWFTKWFCGKKNEFTKSTDIKSYSPNKFGLYKSLVGEDKLKNDMFENLSFRKNIPETPNEEIAEDSAGKSPEKSAPKENLKDEASSNGEEKSPKASGSKSRLPFYVAALFLAALALFRVKKRSEH